MPVDQDVPHRYSSLPLKTVFKPQDASYYFTCICTLLIRVQWGPGTPKKMRSSESRQIQKGSASQAGPSPTAPRQKRCSKSSQVQPRIHIIRQYYSNETGPTSSQQMHPQVSVRIKSSDQQVSPQWWCRAKIKPVTQPSGWDQDQRTT